MEWRDSGFIIGARHHGESSLIVHVLTQHHGRTIGYVRGARSAKRMRGVLILGNRVRVRWYARMAEHLGTFHAELETAFTQRLMDDALALDGLNALCALVETLPERQPAAHIFHHFAFLLERLTEGEKWLADFIRFELVLLAELGFGLEEKDRQKFPAFIFDSTLAASAEDFYHAADLTAHLFEARIYQPRGLPLPAARKKLGLRFAPKKVR